MPAPFRSFRIFRWPVASTLIGLAVGTLTSIYAAPPPGYELVFEDNFDGEELDLRTWYRRTGAKKLVTIKPENVSLRDGNLTIRLDKSGDPKHPYGGGGIITRDAFRYGYFETRSKFWPHPAWWPAFWSTSMVFSSEKPELAVPKTSANLEVDVFEHDSKRLDAVIIGAHRWGPDGHKKHYSKRIFAGDMAKEFHIWGVEVTPEVINYFFNGEKVMSESMMPMPQNPQHWYLSVVNIREGTDESVLPGEVYFDYLRIYQKPELLATEFAIVEAESGLALYPADEKGKRNAKVILKEPDWNDYAYRWMLPELGNGQRILKSGTSFYGLRPRETKETRTSPIIFTDLIEIWDKWQSIQWTLNADPDGSHKIINTHTDLPLAPEKAADGTAWDLVVSADGRAGNWMLCPIVTIPSTDVRYSEAGDWDYGDAYGYFNSSTREAQRPGSAARWSTKLPRAGRYAVETFNPGAARNDTEAKFKIDHAGGSETVLVDLETMGRGWVDIGSYDFQIGQDAQVTYSADQQRGTIDAIRFRFIKPSPKSASSNE